MSKKYFAKRHSRHYNEDNSVKDEGGNINLAYADEELMTKEERDANTFAADALIPKSIWVNAPRVIMNPHFIQKDYSNWAKKMGLNKWIVLGRVSHETGMYMFKSDKSREIN